MEIRKTIVADELRWDEYVLHHPDGLAYHQSAWVRAVSDAYGFSDCSLIAEEAGKVLGVLPLVNFRIPLLGCRLVSLPYCDVGGCLADSEEITSALLSKAVGLGRDKKAKKIEIRQVAKDATVTAGKVRMVLSLPDSAEELLAGFKAKLRSQVKKPLKDGLTGEIVGREGLADFYRVFTQNMRDLGSPVHSYRWFESILNAYGDNAKVGLVKTPDGELAAAGIILLHKTTISIPWASSLRRYNRQNPNMLLYWSFLAFAADQGFKNFDYGRSTLGEGTYKFKKQWGAQPVALDWVDLLHPAASFGKNGSGKLRENVEKIWQKLPVPFATAAGSVLRRYIDL